MSYVKSLIAMLVLVPMALQAQQTNVYGTRPPVQLEDIQSLPDMPTFEEIKIGINQNQEKSKQVGVTYEEFMLSHLQLALKNPAEFIGREGSLHQLLIETILLPAGNLDMQVKKLVEFAAEVQMRIPQGYYNFLLGLKPEVREKFHRAIEVEWETRPANEGLFLALMNQHQFKSPSSVLALSNLLRGTPLQIQTMPFFYAYAREPLALLDLIDVFNTVLNSDAQLKLNNRFNYRPTDPIGSPDILRELERDPRLKQAVKSYIKNFSDPERIRNVAIKLYGHMDFDGSKVEVIDSSASFNFERKVGQRARTAVGIAFGAVNAVALGVSQLYSASPIDTLAVLGIANILSSVPISILEANTRWNPGFTFDQAREEYRKKGEELKKLLRWNGRVNVESLRKALGPFMQTQNDWVKAILAWEQSPSKKPLLQFYEENLKPSAVSCSRAH
jgi:hypothetical protein